MVDRNAHRSNLVHHRPFWNTLRTSPVSLKNRSRSGRATPCTYQSSDGIPNPDDLDLRLLQTQLILVLEIPLRLLEGRIEAPCAICGPHLRKVRHVDGRKHTDVRDQARHRAHGEGAARESEEKHLIAGFVVISDEVIHHGDVGIEPPAEPTCTHWEGGHASMIWSCFGEEGREKRGERRERGEREIGRFVGMDCCSP